MDFVLIMATVVLLFFLLFLLSVRIFEFKYYLYNSFHENFGELMERLLNSLCRTTPRILQLQRSQFQQSVNMLLFRYYRINDDRAALKQIQKQLGFLKSKAIDERHQLDAKIAELQKRIERVKRKMRKVDKESKKSKK
ncbi:uncharacterized protein LOC132788472 isoform X1 [Drosophila nasuta]|uniref:uncharacterized protein LOC132788472 isoform X1 n=1 Tax=Drosophila nasuta TaxID=42062 RepID=UPI001470F1E3|nr:uncharacterized protein LOC132788472 isoform X1 [Drosophila nasuta]